MGQVPDYDVLDDPIDPLPTPPPGEVEEVPVTDEPYTETRPPGTDLDNDEAEPGS